MILHKSAWLWILSSGIENEPRENEQRENEPRENEQRENEPRENELREKKYLFCRFCFQALRKASKHWVRLGWVQ